MNPNADYLGIVTLLRGLRERGLVSGSEAKKIAARLMVQLVVNLVNNAITYTPAGSHIVISIGVDDGHVTCSVADDGPGIAPEDRERIFESFYTANHGLADSHRSVGLGLSLCRSIALAHGGSIEVAAADPHGSVFTIELPVADVSFDKE